MDRERVQLGNESRLGRAEMPPEEGKESAFAWMAPSTT